MDLSTATLQDQQAASPCLVVQQRSCIGKDLSHSPYTQESNMSSTTDRGTKSTLRGSLALVAMQLPLHKRGHVD